MLGLPDHVTACLFDLDGVLTDTASVHDKAWTETFDTFLKDRAARTGTPFVPFDPDKDYDDYVDGLPRADGVRTFLHSRGIELPEGKPDDSPDAETINGLGNRKNALLLKHIKAGRREGLRGFASLPSSRAGRRVAAHRRIVKRQHRGRARGDRARRARRGPHRRRDDRDRPSEGKAGTRHVPRWRQVCRRRARGRRGVRRRTGRRRGRAGRQVWLRGRRQST